MPVQTEPGAAPASSYAWWSLLAGVVFALAAMLIAPLIGLEISKDLANQGGHATWLTLFMGVFVVGALGWWLLVVLTRRFTLLRGAITGALVGFLSYPVVIGLSEIMYRNWAELPPLGERFESVLLVTGLTLLMTGFAATLSMAAVGGIGTLLFARVHKPTAAIMQAFFARLRPPNPFLVAAASVASVAIVAGLAASFAWLALSPLESDAGDAVIEAPAASYEDAVTAFSAIQTAEAGMALHALCHTQLLTHGRKVARVVIYFHGFTSCPAQGDKLAETLFNLGYNVYLPRLYGHGDAVPSVDAMSGLTAAHLTGLANQSVDLAQGLGEDVVVVGLSAGGTMAAWTAQFRPDIDQAIAVSPFFGPYVVPPWATRAATNLVLQAPNVTFAWNPLQDVAGDFPIALPSTHALAEIMLVGRQVQEAARATPPAIPEIGVLLNDADVAVSNALSEEIIADWRSHGAKVQVEVLPFSLRLPHDIMNHRERGSSVDLVHSMIIELMGP